MTTHLLGTSGIRSVQFRMLMMRSLISAQPLAEM